METINNPGEQRYAECGCSEKVFRFKQSLYGEVFEIRYWLALGVDCQHRMDKVRVYLVRETDGVEKLIKVSA